MEGNKHSELRNSEGAGDCGDSSPELIELRKVEVVGDLGQTFHLAGVRK